MSVFKCQYNTTNFQIHLIRWYFCIMIDKCEYEYGVSEQFIDFNKGDPDLDVIRVYLPRPPKYHLIDGYGLPPDEQVFKRHEIPQKLLELEKTCSSIDEIWDTMKNNYRL